MSSCVAQPFIVVVSAEISDVVRAWDPTCRGLEWKGKQTGPGREQKRPGAFCEPSQYFMTASDQEPATKSFY